jgi:hypothetical protein
LLDGQRLAGQREVAVGRGGFGHAVTGEVGDAGAGEAVEHLGALHAVAQDRCSAEPAGNAGGLLLGVRQAVVVGRLRDADHQR